MTMASSMRARSLAGALLLLVFAAGLGVFAPAATSAAERVRFALEREGTACPDVADGTVWGLRSVEPGAAADASASGCVLQMKLPGLTDADLQAAATRLATSTGSPALILEMPEAGTEWTTYAVELLASPSRGASTTGLVGLDRKEDIPSEELAPYVDALARRPGEAFPEESERREWLLALPSESGSPVSVALSALAT